VQLSSLNTSGRLEGGFLVLFVKAEPWEAGGSSTRDRARQESIEGFPQKNRMKNAFPEQTERGRPAVSPLQINNNRSNKSKASILPTSSNQQSWGFK